MAFRAVLFDLGGVVVGSPLEAIAAYERELGVPPNAVNRIVVGAGSDGAWARLERGEMDLESFFAAFEADCAAAGVCLSARELMLRVSAVTEPRPVMLEAIRRIRAHGLITGAITNNWVAENSGTAALAPLFDLVLESSILGLRKPDPRIFELACERLAIAPAEAVFLDDIGANLKTARALGMATIKVRDPEAALDELE